jgi:hypothetical protein
MPIIGVKCDKFVTKSQAPTTPYGVPPTSLFRERDNPPKKSMQQCFTRIGDFTWRVSDCEELVCVQIEFIHPFFGYLCYRDTMFA